MRTTKDRGEIRDKIHQRLFSFMKTRDLHFFMGTCFRFPTWLIIGLFYPPKGLLGQKGIGEYAGGPAQPLEMS